MESILDRVGELIGSAIRFVIDLIRWVFFGIDDAIDSFLEGVARGIGLSDHSILQLAIVAVGLMLFWFAFRAFVGRRIIVGILWVLFGLVVVGWVVR